MLVITGWGSQIAVELRRLVEEYAQRATYDAMPLDGDRYFFCAGLLLPKTLEQMTHEEREQTYEVNCGQPARCCERILAANSKARICVMGSESGYSGSYNSCYANSKTMLHHYVQDKKLQPEQQLVAVSPGIISDAGMTLRRTDLQQLNLRQEQHPKRRFVTSLEVAKLVRFLLYEDNGYITNTVIRMHGGENLT